MQIITTNEFDKAVSEGVVLVDFFADWCGPCKMLAPVLENLSREYEGRATILKVNVDNDPDLARRFGVAAIPTLVLFKDGAEVKTVMGYQAAPALTQLLDSAL
ncbi:MAG: thioredoxin [Erysipelotrichaceae bacterium]|nr:thioredoxin [Erysipelotrichaceae bacterium]MBR3352114.1 thioredoxin [Erysipelotrichaceae bacterium]MBR6957725.1 thioredoxin [Erysipelotrichaceae bacterium]